MTDVTRDRDETGNYVIVHDTATPPSVATNDELIGVYNDCPEDSQKAALRDVYNLGFKHGQASSREVAAPAPVAWNLPCGQHAKKHNMETQ